ncbi:plasmid stabilization system protein ParE [Algoriphagus sp. 4150]|uniref:type II toxin-antitoxin system RelE/ParE family toxin n=1 Tax=Algoriphagus sp. 4150 TaxID=2817756 RepID=UPI00286691FD|nr:type II toxin-antitoxin system RelE/ParE family toxin [Algoriphagus sp. 4150]MDR7128654.1 plasmid stabilization system protein ParE [Algoriphagus sp. 4150]
MKIHFTEEAWNSLDKTTDFYLFELEIPAFIVDKIVRELLKKVQLLVENPYLGQKEPFLSHLGKNHRRIFYMNIKIIYRIEEDKLYITDFFDSRQNPSKMKF